MLALGRLIGQLITLVGLGSELGLLTLRSSVRAKLRQLAISAGLTMVSLSLWITGVIFLFVSLFCYLAGLPDLAYPSLYLGLAAIALAVLGLAVSLRYVRF